MQARDGQGGGPPADSLDAEVAAQNRRVAELTRGGRVRGYDAVHRVRAEANAELVKVNAAAQSPTREPTSEPSKPAARAPEQAPVKGPSRPKSVHRSYSYEQGNMASHQTDGVRHMQTRQRFKAKQHADRQGAQGEKANSPQTSSPEKAPDRKTAPGPDADRSQRYRELMKASQARQHSRGHSGPDQSRE
jgi:hypothetical protein